MSYYNTPRENLITVQGEGGVGKTSFVQAILRGCFNPEYDPTIDEDYQPKVMNIDGQLVNLFLHDQAGREEYSAMRDLHLRMCKGMIICFAMNNRRSFEEIENFREALLRVKDTDHFPMLLLGTKCDLTDAREVSTQEAQSWAESKGIRYLEVSAKTRVNLDEAMTDIVRSMRDYAETPRPVAKTKPRSFGSRCSVM